MLLWDWPTKLTVATSPVMSVEGDVVKMKLGGSWGLVVEVSGDDKVVSGAVNEGDGMGVVFVVSIGVDDDVEGILYKKFVPKKWQRAWFLKEREKE